ncbi:MAG: hypothetical protein IT179_16445 [Acidobacteria bacterium]|nr:hypothetical protein [Acidobacteriota bacterium]
MGERPAVPPAPIVGRDMPSFVGMGERTAGVAAVARVGGRRRQAMRAAPVLSRVIWLAAWLTPSGKMPIDTPDSSASNSRSNVARLSTGPWCEGGADVDSVYTSHGSTPPWRR